MSDCLGGSCDGEAVFFVVLEENMLKLKGMVFANGHSDRFLVGLGR